MSARGFIVAGTASGVGKTTVASSIAAALRARGLRVQPFKTGPDYIDPTYLSRAAGRPCRNLDTWMLSDEAVRELYARAAANADVTVVEGVMGLFDGRDDDGRGSAAHLAKLLGLPILLVVDASAMARSAAAVVLGFQQFDPALRFAGVVLNRVAGERHAALCAGPIAAATGLPVLGAIPRTADVTLPERHLGLVPEVETSEGAAWCERVAALARTHLDLDALDARATHVAYSASVLFPTQPLATRAAIAIAQDEAFHFYYQDSLDLLAAWGAELRPFSPLNDARLPVGCGAVYIGGGFPELFAAALAENTAMKAALADAAMRGVQIYGECGGLMYLGDAITDFEGQRHAMTGLVRAHSIMRASRLTLGYREVESMGTPLLPAGERTRGHEFHWSSLEQPADLRRAAYRVLDEEGRADGFRAGPVTATYIHTHMAARADLASNFVRAAEAGGRTP